MKHLKQFLIAISALALSSCATLMGGGASDPVINADDLTMVQGANPSNTCLVTGLVDGTKEAGTGLAGAIEHEGKRAALVFKGAGALDASVFYALVPQGSFEVKYLALGENKKSNESCWGANNKCVVTYGEPATVADKNPLPGKHGALPAAYKGTCKGGFVFLGVYEAVVGGLMSSSKFTEMSTGMYMPGERFQSRHFAALKEQLKGTPWESLIK
ncbi:MAG: hypothetical protein LDLANPLL_01330 [Turneriella sp.]|nr:hypothetical protein [Turneriella sp.]